MRFFPKPINPKKRFMDAAFFNNPVLVRGLCICPILTAGTSLKNAVVLTVCLLVALLPSAFLLPVLKKVPKFYQAPIVAVSSAVLLVGAMALLNFTMSTRLYAALYLFVPLFISDALLGKVVDSRQKSVSDTAIELLAVVVGFGLVACGMGVVREFVATNTVWGVSVGDLVNLPQIVLPFAGFLMLGFLAAFFRHVHALFSSSVLEEETIQIEKEDDSHE